MSFLSDLKKENSSFRERCFPGTQTKIKLRVLTGAESQTCAVAAQAYMKEKYDVDYGPFLADVFSEENDWQTLFKAVTDLQGNPIANEIEEFRAKLTDAERLALATEYNDVCAECAPQIDTMTDKQFNELVSEVKKKPDQAVQSICGISLLRKLIVTMASQLTSSPMDN